MQAKVNVQLIKATTFDSGALGMMAMVLHQFTSAGRHRVAIMEEGQHIADTGFDVDEESEVMQLDIDLAASAREAKGRRRDCDCPSDVRDPMVVSPKGYVLFHASSGSGYSVKVATAEDRMVFNSTKLVEGDLFAVSLLEPTTYSMTNTAGSAKGEIVVRLTPEMSKRIRALDTFYVDARERSFDPDRVELTSSQGLVFRIKGNARILIDKKDPKRSEGTKPVIRWRKLQVID